MTERFEMLTRGISTIYKSIQHIKKHNMNSMGLKGTHVMCLYFLAKNPDGLTATDLCNACRENKAGISRILADLEAKGFITYLSDNRYRARAVLTELGKSYAEDVNHLIINATIAGGAGLTEQERETFYHVLFKIADNLSDLCDKLDNDDISGL